jgi:multicomponent Na+:H+ antiporter subunit F
MERSVSKYSGELQGVSSARIGASKTSGKWIASGAVFDMSAFYIGVALFLLLNIFAGMIRLVQGPTAADRMLAVQLFGSTGVAILLLLSQAYRQPVVQNVALVFALLAVMAVVAFVKRVRSNGSDTGRISERK